MHTKILLFFINIQRFNYKCFFFVSKGLLSFWSQYIELKYVVNQEKKNQDENKVWDKTRKTTCSTFFFFLLLIVIYTLIYVRENKNNNDNTFSCSKFALFVWFCSFGGKRKGDGQLGQESESEEEGVVKREIF